MEHMTQPVTRSIDVTGLSVEAIRTVESLVSLLRVQAPFPSAVPLSADQWTKQFAAWMRDVAARAHQYPPGFVVDDSHDTMYEGRGE
jgi:hypothetical protein